MDATEAHAERHLVHAGLGPVRYEPDGNRAPDFVTADGTAVEVRRLNQHFDLDGKPVPLEHDDFPILRGMRRVLASFGESRDGRSWWVNYGFHRPAPLWKDLEPKVRAALRRIDESEATEKTEIEVDSHFSLDVFPCSTPHQERFVLAGYSDDDAGGWLLYELQRNIQLCVDEKTAKIADSRDRYARWWLILVDHIGYGGSELEAELFRDRVHIHHTWDRVVLLSPLDHTRAVVVESSPPAV